MTANTLPTIAHATVSLNQWGRVVVQMDDGWVFCDMRDYENLTDEDGNPREPLPEELCYFRYGVFSPATDIEHCLLIVAETDVPADQIFGLTDNQETI